ncbi:pathogenesis-related BetVI family protein [Alcaligenes ammonioxydans]|uniref:pathogenesis-related BetVI family protein n=1 Tax=Alcaligenes ammonioxydans TaxID=2582914 RepID=UPI001F05264A|nr:pathogenesis-related BetVI family protein [Alcaligenes ammonioxydans]MCH1881320.1 pathogenesis-related BetVI family protein [Alcaligenes ammonioxydans]
MSSGSWSHEVTAAVPAGQLFKAAMLDWHNLGPKVAPEVIASASVISGDKAVGGIREFKFTPAMPFSYLRERLDFLDLEKFELKNTIVEGGTLGKQVESGTSHFKFEPSGNGCVVKVVASYKLVAGVQDDPSEIAKAKEAVTKHIKAAEAYLLANPTAYA